MKVLAYSDLHLDLDAADAILDRAANADLVLGAGDFAQRHMGLGAFMKRLEPIAAKSVLVPGNNESLEALRSVTSAEVLHGQATARDGLVIVGLGGGIPPLPKMPWGSWDMTEEEAEAALAPFESCDILICHSPPRGVGDHLAGTGHIGSVSLRVAIERMKPKIAVFGHVHDDWGAEARIGDTICRNLGPGGWEIEL